MPPDKLEASARRVYTVRRAIAPLRVPAPRPVPAKVVNITKGSLLAERAVVASTYLQRLVGLIGRRCLPAGEGLILSPCQAIHTFFMRFPIDVIFFDDTSHILHLEENMPPFRMSRFVPGARYVLELPAGTIRKTATEKGDMLNFLPAE